MIHKFVSDQSGINTVQFHFTLILAGAGSLRMALNERPRKRWTNNYENPYQKVGISNQQSVACNQQIAIGILNKPEPMSCRAFGARHSQASYR